jgi:hypothetical protein
LKKPLFGKKIEILIKKLKSARACTHLLERVPVGMLAQASPKYPKVAQESQKSYKSRF